MHSVNASHLTVRDLPERVASALEKERRRRGTSLNQTVIDLLGQSLGVSSKRSNGLARLAGAWSAKEQRQFLSGIRRFKEIDTDFWK
jgi:hypothetical protein